MMRFAWFRALIGSPAAGLARSVWGKYLLAAVLIFALWFSSPAAPAAPAQVFETGVQGNLSIAGQGYFVLRDPVSGQFMATRFGEFFLDGSGYLISEAGFRVQGYSDDTLTTLGDLQVISLEDSAEIYNYDIGTDGLIHADLADGTDIICGQVLLQNFTTPQQLVRSDYRALTWNAPAGPLPQVLPPGSAGLGTILPETLEIPNDSLQLNRVNGPPSPLTHGMLHPTGCQTDLGIQGDGFFVLRDTNSGAFFATRCGAFELDPDGWLVNYSGLRVQGFNTDSLTLIGDVRMLFTGQAPGYTIYTDGEMEMYHPDGSADGAGQILLRQCASSNLPPRLAFSLFPLDTNNPAWTPFTPPGRAGLGRLAPGFIEVSQYDQSIVNARRVINQFPMGSLEIATPEIYLALNGSGFFIVRDPFTGALSATRQGNFQLDGAGHLVATNGCRLQGLADSARSMPGDLTLNTLDEPSGTDPHATIQSLSVNMAGMILLTLSDGTTYVRGQITLQYFRDLQALHSSDGLFFTNLAAAGPMFTNATPGTLYLATIDSQALEQIPSLRLPELDFLPQTGFRVLINDVVNSPTIIEASTDLVHWHQIGAVTDASNLDQAEFFDTNAPAAGRFYRTSN